MFLFGFLLLSSLSTALASGDKSGHTEVNSGIILFPEDVPGNGPAYRSSNHDDTADVSDLVNDLSTSSNNKPLAIPLDFIQEISENNMTELLLNYMDGDIDLDSGVFSIADRFGSDEDDSARNGAKVLKMASCTPEITTVKLATSTDPSILYIPQCVKIERCNGCCSHHLLECQPTEIEKIAHEVLKTQYTGGKRLKPIKKELVIIERHVKCKCDCRTKEGDCNKYQEYRKSQCMCVCTNTDEEKKCFKNSLKLWDPNLCACQCREIFNCSSGYSFDHHECKCNPLTDKRAKLSKPYLKDQY